MDEPENNEQKNSDKFIQYLIAGSLLGVGGGMTAGLVRMLNNNRKMRSSEDDDDTIYLTKNSSIANGLAFGGGLGAGGYLGFLLGDEIIKTVRRRQAQEALDEAQNQALKIRGFEVVDKEDLALNKDSDLHLNKTASFISDVSTGVGTLAALLMLGSGIASYNYLDESYPIKELEEDSLNPKKFKIIDKDQLSKQINTNEAEKELIEEVVKNASDMSLPAFMLHATEKKASIASNVISTVAAGLGYEFEKAVENLGFGSALNLVKGASDANVDPIAEQAAILYCTKEASFAPSFNLLVASEFTEFNPGLLKVASQLNRDQISYITEFNMDMNNIIKFATALDLGAKYSDIDAAMNNQDGYIGIKNNILNIINKQASNFLITNNNAATASQLSGGGICAASKKDEEIIKQEARNYNQALNKENKSTDKDPIDDTLEVTDIDLNDIK